MESALFKRRDRSAVPSVGRLGGRLLESSSRESWRRSVRLFGRSTETKLEDRSDLASWLLAILWSNLGASNF